jgi:Sulfotransferase family
MPARWVQPDIKRGPGVTPSADLAAAEFSSQRRIPDFFIVGHPKSGTTALYTMLRDHPQIFMPKLKEPLYFSSDMSLRFPTPRSGKVPQTLDAYLALFAEAQPEQLWGEASSSYLWSQSAASAIAEAQPAARIIAVLREPASFLRSLHLQLMQIHVESQGDFRKAIALESARREGKRIPRRSHRPQLLLYSEHVRYVEQLRRYESRFPPGQMMVIIYDDFRADNEATVRAILRFLDLDDAAPVRVKDANPTVAVRSPRLHELSQALALGQGRLWRTVNTAVKALGPRQVKLAVALRERLLMGKPRLPDDELMLELRRRFKPEVVALSEHLDRDLVTLWGYDRLD